MKRLKRTLFGKTELKFDKRKNEKYSMRPMVRGKIALYLLLSFIGCFVGTGDLRAFSLMGPYEPWMTSTNGFDLNGDIGGPMNIGNGYRWNVPVITYAYDSSFTNFFGTNGVAAVESAIQLLNNLPPASQIDPSTFPFYSQYLNSQAQTLDLVDLKSEALYLLLQQLGLASPQRFMYCVRDYSVADGVSNAIIVLRNFDPFSFTATNAINGTLFGSILNWQVSNGTQVDSVTITPTTSIPNPFGPPFEIADDLGTAVADGGLVLIYNPGTLYTNLTSDDVGGLRYLLQTNNYNLEPLLPDVHGVGANAGNYVNVALRGGVDKITFVRESVDPIMGEFFSPVTNQYTDIYITNDVLMSQQLERVTTRPDILFSVYSSAMGDTPAVICTSTTNWLNTGSLYGTPGAAGPGIIRPQVTIAFRKNGYSATAVTTDSGFPYNPVPIQTRLWASFDSSSNAPVIYPAGALTGSGSPWMLEFLLLNQNSQLLSGSPFLWQVPVSLGGVAVLEKSSDLIDWTPMATVTNYGIPLVWGHFYSQSSGYFRVVPQ